ncbi:MAG TPA: endonuclease/exonuclease/phosphatase family protein [Candidatus Saccharimonadia bacterium]|jgi:endonuclease/exonuclease/phosphatase family metal-dependent hydrolase|nr:endonuclease/exonuclease/phosphatase family protein [Candidatus Saccharimonadia bacterium]
MTIKFITVNVWHGGRLMDNLIKFLQAEDPDILVLQEAYNDPRPELSARFRTVETLQMAAGLPHASFAASFMHVMPDLRTDQGNAVLSKFELTPGAVTFFHTPYDPDYSEEGRTDFSRAPRNLQHVVAHTPAGDMNVFNLHGIWDLEGDRYSPERARMTEAIIRATHGLPRVILAGDTNATMGNKAIAVVEEQLMNVFGHELTTTFNMRRKDNPGYATAVVDMIFVSPDIKVLSKDCPDVDASDHLPLVATLEV